MVVFTVRRKMNIKKYHEQVVTAWKHFRTFYERQYDETFWNAYADALEDPAVREMAGSRFGMDLLHAVTKELERIKREETNQNTNNPPVSNYKSR